MVDHRFLEQSVRMLCWVQKNWLMSHLSKCNSWTMGTILLMCMEPTATWLMALRSVMMAAHKSTWRMAIAGWGLQSDIMPLYFDQKTMHGYANTKRLNQICNIVIWTWIYYPEVTTNISLQRVIHFATSSVARNGFSIAPTTWHRLWEVHGEGGLVQDLGGDTVPSTRKWWMEWLKDQFNEMNWWIGGYG